MTPEQFSNYRQYIRTQFPNQFDDPYVESLRQILMNGALKIDRTGTGTISLFGQSITVPVVDPHSSEETEAGKDVYSIYNTQSKPIHWKSVAHELIWFLGGETNTKYLKDNGVTIWDEWADEEGELGPVYGSQWRAFGGETDQIIELIENPKTDPTSRRHVVTAWNPNDIKKMALPPCHMTFQIVATPIGEDVYELDMLMYQRSADMFLGVPFNIQSYSLLLAMICSSANRGGNGPEFVTNSLKIVFGDAHVYLDHIGQVEATLSRQKYIDENDKNSTTFSSRRRISIKPQDCLSDYNYSDIEVGKVFTMPRMPAPVSV